MEYKLGDVRRREVRRDCNICSGKGKVPTEKKRCPVCNGDAWIATGKEGEELRCRECWGTGSVPKSYKQCERCDAQGYTIDQEYEKAEQCKECDGGKVPIEGVSPLIAEVTGEETHEDCATCSGTGIGWVHAEGILNGMVFVSLDDES